MVPEFSTETINSTGGLSRESPFLTLTHPYILQKGTMAYVPRHARGTVPPSPPPHESNSPRYGPTDLAEGEEENGYGNGHGHGESSAESGPSRKRQRTDREGYEEEYGNEYGDDGNAGEGDGYDQGQQQAQGQGYDQYDTGYYPGEEQEAPGYGGEEHEGYDNQEIMIAPSIFGVAPRNSVTKTIGEFIMHHAEGKQNIEVGVVF